MGVRGVLAGAALVALWAGGPGTAGPAAAGGGASWPFYGRDLANTRVQPQETRITRATVGGMQPRWFFPTGRDVTATPIVVDGTVYVGDFGGRFYALDAATGALRWSRTLNGPVVDTAASAGGRVFVGDNLRTFWALDAATGEVVWRVTPDVPEDIRPFVQFWGSPVPFEDRILVGLAAEDKEISFTLDRKRFRGGVVALAQSDGRTLWYTPTVPERCAPDQPPDVACNGGSVWTTPAVDPVRRLAFWGVGNAYDPPAAPLTDAIIAVRVDDGSLVWGRQFQAGDYWSYGVNICCNPDVDFGSSPVLFELDGRAVLGEGQKNGVFHVVDRDTGEVVWERKLAGGRSGSTAGGFLSSPAYASGRFFFGATDDVVDTPVNTMSSHLAFSDRDGTVFWERLSPAWLWSAAAVTNGVVFQGTSLGTMVALDAETGELLWSSLPLGAVIASGPSVADGAIFFGVGCCGTGGETHGVHAFALPEG